MALEGNFEYALTRVQSQYGERPDTREWRRLEASHDLGQYLEAARGGIFGAWVAALDRNRETHGIERTLRGAWRSYVRTVAEWHPADWQPWLTWLEWLPTLPLLARLKSPASMPAWLLADPILATAATGGAAERAIAVKKSPLAPFEPGIAEGRPLAELWLARWRALRPPIDAFTAELLARVSRAVREHLGMLAAEGADGEVLRDQLRARLQRLFRAASGTVVATLCHLMLMALDFERLRGGLVNRSLFARAGTG
jgi:hypothetical protein